MLFVVLSSNASPPVTPPTVFFFSEVASPSCSTVTFSAIVAFLFCPLLTVVLVLFVPFFPVPASTSVRTFGVAT
jgi:hypothetical protein